MFGPRIVAGLPVFQASVTVETAHVVRRTLQYIDYNQPQGFTQTFAFSFTSAQNILFTAPLNYIEGWRFGV